ncbi:unnamed protein product, partial [Durusdinium trenchii]
AFDRIRSTLGRGQTKTEWEFLGKKVCVSAWKKLHALGTGRFNRLVAAARAGEIALLAVPGYSICVPGVDSWQLESQWCSKELEGVAERNPIAADFADKILRHLPILRENPYNLHAAADHLESWVLGSLPRAPLLDVTGMGAMTADDRRSATHYVGRAKRRVALTAAAQAWAAGVPWAEALRICKRAVSRASPKAKALPKRRARR